MADNLTASENILNELKKSQELMVTVAHSLSHTNKEISDLLPKWHETQTNIAIILHDITGIKEQIKEHCELLEKGRGNNKPLLERMQDNENAIKQIQDSNKKNYDHRVIIVTLIIAALSALTSIAAIFKK